MSAETGPPATCRGKVQDGKSVLQLEFGWLLSVPASGERSYYEKLIGGEVTRLKPAGHGHHDSDHHAAEAPADAAH